METLARINKKLRCEVLVLGWIIFPADLRGQGSSAGKSYAKIAENIHMCLDNPSSVSSTPSCIPKLKAIKTVKKYLTGMGSQIVKANDLSLDYFSLNFEIYFSREKPSVPDAFSFNSGFEQSNAIEADLICQIPNNSALAWVISHELAHLVLGYSHIGFLTENDPNLKIDEKKKLLREAERMADYLGGVYMARAGYDLRGSVAALRYFHFAQDKPMPHPLRSHPTPWQRIENMARWLPMLEQIEPLAEPVDHLGEMRGELQCGTTPLDLIYWPSITAP